MEYKQDRFVEYVFTKVHEKGDKAFSAKLRKADTSATEYQSWEILSRWIDLDNELDRRAYGLIGSSIARSKQAADGVFHIGEALYHLFKAQGSIGELEKTSAAVRMRRLLACKDALELILVLRPVIRLVESKDIHISYRQLLKDILMYNYENSRDGVRTRWAQKFFRHDGEVS